MRIHHIALALALASTPAWGQSFTAGGVLPPGAALAVNQAPPDDAVSAFTIPASAAVGGQASTIIATKGFSSVDLNISAIPGSTGLGILEGPPASNGTCSSAGPWYSVYVVPVGGYNNTPQNGYNVAGEYFAPVVAGCMELVTSGSTNATAITGTLEWRTAAAPPPQHPMVTLDAGSSFVGTVSIKPVLSAPTGGNYAVTTAAATAIAANATRLRWSYQAQGTGYACASWVTASVTIAVSSANVVTCGGAGAFALSAGSAASSSEHAVASTALTIIGAAPTSGTLALNLVYEQQ